MLSALLIAIAAQSQKLNGPLLPGGDVSVFGWAPEGRDAVYLADQDVDGVNELYTVALGPSPVQVKVNEPLYEPGPGEELRISPISGDPCVFLPGPAQVLYLETHVDSFSVSNAVQRASRSGSPPPEPYPATPYSDRVRGDHVVFVKVLTGGITTLWSATIEPPVTEVQLSPGLTGFTQSLAARQTSDGATTVFAYQTYNPSGPDALWSVPTDGSSAATALNGSTNPQRQTRAFLVHPSDLLVVYVADDVVDDVDELWKAPIDASSAPVRLGQPLSGAQDVTGDILLSPDGARVAFRADADTDEVFELYSVALGGSPVVKLNGPMVTGGDVPAALGGVQFAFSPDGAWVVYRADQDSDEVFELFAAPADGAHPPVKLHPALAGSQDVPLHGFRIAPDSQGVVFAADTDVAARVELWSAPIDGSAGAVRLNPPMISGGSLRLESPFGAQDTFALARRHVVYLADQDTDETFELFRIPADGSMTAVRCNDALASGGDVTGFSMGPGGGAVLYRADQGTDDTFELYLTEFPEPAPPSRPAPAPSRTVTRSFP